MQVLVVRAPLLSAAGACSGSPLHRTKEHSVLLQRDAGCLAQRLLRLHMDKHTRSHTQDTLQGLGLPPRSILPLLRRPYLRLQQRRQVDQDRHQLFATGLTRTMTTMTTMTCRATDDCALARQS